MAMMKGRSAAEPEDEAMMVTASRPPGQEAN
jgi:hypothetical protein